MTHTIALPSQNEFEFLASILATWDETNEGILHKRHALDQLLIRSEIDGYVKSYIAEGKVMKWQKQGSHIVVLVSRLVSRVEDGMYTVEVRAKSIRVKATVKEL